MSIRFYLLIFGCFISATIFAQNATQPQENGYFRAIYRNDFFTATDYYYTQGIRFEYSKDWIKKLPTKHILLGLQNTDFQQHTLYIRQDGYTPTSIRSDTILTGDRPFSSTLRIGQQRLSKRKNGQLVLLSEFDIGVIGKYSFGAEEQVFIHKITGNKEPFGWQHQIASDVVLNYVMQLDKSLFQTSFGEFLGGVNATIGTLNNQVGAQVHLKLGRLNHTFLQKNINLLKLIFSEKHAPISSHIMLLCKVVFSIKIAPILFLRVILID